MHGSRRCIYNEFSFDRVLTEQQNASANLEAQTRWNDRVPVSVLLSLGVSSRTRSTCDFLLLQVKISARGNSVSVCRQSWIKVKVHSVTLWHLRCLVFVFFRENATVGCGHCNIKAMCACCDVNITGHLLFGVIFLMWSWQQLLQFSFTHKLWR